MYIVHTANVRRQYKVRIGMLAVIHRMENTCLKE